MTRMRYRIWDTALDRPADGFGGNAFLMRADAEAALADFLQGEACRDCRSESDFMTALEGFDGMDDSAVAESDDAFEIRSMPMP